MGQRRGSSQAHQESFKGPPHWHSRDALNASQLAEGLGGRAGGRVLYVGTRSRPELDLRIALRGDVFDDPDEFRRAAVVDEVADRALFVAGDVGVVAGEPRLGFAHQHDLVHLDHMYGPTLLRLVRGFGTDVAMVPHILL